MELSERARAILDFERTWWQQTGSKNLAIRERFGLSGTRYYELVGAVVVDEAALAYDPLTVKRLRRAREMRRRSRLEGSRRPPVRDERDQ